MKNQITSWLIIVGLVAVGVLVYVYGSRPTVPEVGEDGKISGSYTIEGIMGLNKPYRCTFEKTDGTSSILGVMRVQGENAYVEFRIRTGLMSEEFNSFLLIKGGEAYTWTSLQNVGYKSVAAKSASRNASPLEQTQIVGTRDKVEYKCEPWQYKDASLFEAPSWVTFTDLK